MPAPRRGCSDSWGRGSARFGPTLWSPSRGAADFRRPALDSTAATPVRPPASCSASSPLIGSLRRSRDASLRRRPMRRVTGPLSQMGARFTEWSEGDGLPLSIRGARLAPLRYELPVSSAQIKSALLLAGLAGGVEVALREPYGRS